MTRTVPEPSSQRRGRKNDPEAMRHRILDVAAALFHSRGYHSTSMHDITREAGVTSGALHHHFPTKKALGLTVVHERVARAVEETWIDPVNAARGAHDGMSAAFHNVIAELEQRGEVRGCPLNNLALELSLSDPELRSAIQGVFARWQASIARKLRSDEAAGASQDRDADELATLVVATYSGAMALAKASQDAAPLRACAAQLARLLPQRRDPRRHGRPRSRRAM